MNTNRLFSSFAVLSLLALVSGCSGSSSDHGSTSTNGAKGGSTTGTGSNGGAAGGGDEASPGTTPAGGLRFFLPTTKPDNTSAPMVVTDTIGNVHSVYPAYAKGGAYYAYCGGDCKDQSGVKVVKLDTPDGTVTNASIALDAQNHPRVLLNAFHNVYYATCDANCGEQASWTMNSIYDHQGKLEVSGEALALDPQGRPRFLMHTYRTFAGIGQGDPKTLWASCDANCGQAASWTATQMQTENLENGQLRFDAQGTARLFASTLVGQEGAKTQSAAYLECATNCGVTESWHGIGLGDVFTSENDAFSIKPSLSMSLTKAGNPRVAFLANSSTGREIHYLECDQACTDDNWKGTILSVSSKLGAGLDLALGANDEPRLAYTLDWNIALATCDHGDCTKSGDSWGITKVEKGEEMPPDQIFLYTNCNVSAWFLLSPSVAVTPSGEIRVGYQARDASGGFGHTDTTHQDCVAGTDMAWDRIAYLPASK